MKSPCTQPAARTYSPRRPVNPAASCGGASSPEAMTTPGVAQPDLGALVDDLGACTAGHGALHPGRPPAPSSRAGPGVRAPWRRARWAGLRVRRMVQARTPSTPTWARLVSKRRVIRLPAECWPTGCGLPAVDTAPVALTMRWISTGAPATRWGEDGRAGGGPGGRALGGQSSQVDAGQSRSRVLRCWPGPGQAHGGGIHPQRERSPGPLRAQPKTAGHIPRGSRCTAPPSRFSPHRSAQLAHPSSPASCPG